MYSRSTLVLVLCFLAVAVAFNSFVPRNRFAGRSIQRTAVWMTETEESTKPNNMVMPEEVVEEETVEEIPENESPEQKYKREKMAEIADLKAREVFVTRNTGKYECQACGYIYDESKGVPKKGIPAGSSFESMEKFRCPECGANKKYFVAETETLSGFKENLKFGIGTNALTGAQKGNLIFGGLFLGFLLFMSGYLLE